MSAAARLPGIRIDVAPRPLAEALPPMDVAVFVGFAATGPVHRPVAIETVAQFRAVFGPDPGLAFDEGRGERVYGYLGSAVRGFFANGGRRCWVIRVARTPDLEVAWARVARRTPRLTATATANRFRVPGVLALTADGEGNGGTLTPAEVQARSLGSWSDGLRLATALVSAGFTVTGCRPLDPARRAWIRFSSTTPLWAGDLIELGGDGVTGAPPGSRLFAIVDGPAPWTECSGAAPAVAAILCAAFSRLDLNPTSPPVSSPPQPALAGAVGEVQGAAGETLTATLEVGETSEDRGPGVRLRFAAAASPAPEGEWLRWRRADEVVEDEEGGQQVVWVRGDRRLGSRGGLTVEGPGWLEQPQALPDPPPTRARRLLLDLRVVDRNGTVSRLGGVGLTPGHPSAWWRQTSDDRYYGQAPETPASLPSGTVPAGRLAFPLAALDQEPGAQPTLAWIPLGVDALFGAALGSLPQIADALERDGLSCFNAELFLDPDLASRPIERLLEEADRLRFDSDTPRGLFGIHAALAIGGGETFNEASLIAVPDAVHTGWERLTAAAPPPATPSPPAAPPHWRDHRGPCAAATAVPGLTRPDFSRFLDCGTRRLQAPVLHGPVGPMPRGVIDLSWDSAEPDLNFVLEEARTADFANPREVCRGPDHRAQVQVGQEGHYYFRVSASLGGERSAPSTILAVTVRDDRWLARGGAEPAGDAAGAGMDTLLRTHRELLALAAATGELFAVLSLPRHFRAPEAIRHAGRLRAVAGDPAQQRALSFGALYHPWVQCVEPLPATGRRGDHPLPPGAIADSPRHVCPPDGVAMGVLARRAQERGAWVAPANEPLRGLLALTPAIAPSTWLALQEARVNLVRADPRGFLCLDADTLSVDPDWRAINVRRLFSLLRRLALRRGLSYVFEPNDDVLRRAVERGFTALLTDLDRRGAFAGATADESFRVVTSGAINTAADRAAGRFVVELRVAPALPLRFLALRLLQRGERLTLIEEA